jgi:2-polyprenyl-3-methyl-5-hydroxy-6-metoxy-1,4-benzoquinol methylase
MSIDYLTNYDFIFNNDNFYARDYLKEELKNPQYKMIYEYLLLNKNNIKTHVSIGSGRGEFLHYIDHLGFEQTTVDLKKFHNFGYPFIRCDLSKQEDLDNLKRYHWDVLTCLDVMEHIEEDKVDAILSTLSQIADVCLFTIANHEDTQHGIKLHLTVEDDKWWNKKLEKYFKINDFKKIRNNVVYYYEVIEL